MKPGIEQDIYEALLNTKKITSETAESLTSLADSIKKIMESILSKHYEENAEKKKVLAAGTTNPAIPVTLSDEAAKQSVQKLKNIHDELTETTMQMKTNEALLSLLHDDQPGNPAIKKSVDTHLNDVNKIGEFAKKAKKEFKTLNLLLGDLDKIKASPQVAKKLNAELDAIYQNLRDLRLQAKAQQQTIEPYFRIGRKGT